MQVEARHSVPKKMESSMTSDDQIKCNHCGTENKKEAVFCKNCGIKFSLSCHKCGFDSDPGSTFCSHCGAKLKEEPIPLQTTETKAQVQTEEKPLHTNRKNIRGFAIAGILLVALGLVFVILKFSNIIPSSAQQSESNVVLPPQTATAISYAYARTASAFSSTQEAQQIAVATAAQALAHYEDSLLDLGVCWLSPDKKIWLQIGGLSCYKDASTGDYGIFGTLFEEHIMGEPALFFNNITITDEMGTQYTSTLETLIADDPVANAFDDEISKQEAAGRSSYMFMFTVPLKTKTDTLTLTLQPLQNGMPDITWEIDLNQSSILTILEPCE